MAILPANLDYTDKDFDSINERLTRLLRSVFPTWTAQQVANFGVLLKEMFSFVLDVIGYYVDAHALESRWGTATQRKAIISLAKLIAYKLPGATAAFTDIQITASSVPLAAISIPAGSIIKTKEVTSPIAFQLQEDISISAGANPPVGTGMVEHSRRRIYRFDSTGLANQEVMLPLVPYLDDSAYVVAEDGTYTEVDGFLSSGSEDRHFIVVVDQNDRATIRFGNGTNGAVPSGSCTVYYKTGGGTEGNVEQGSLTELEGNFYDAEGNVVYLSCTNPEAAGGGTPRQSVAQARELAPQSIKVLNRTVAREDYEVAALEAGAARALMLTSDETSLIQENNGILYLVPRGGGEASATLKAAALYRVTITKPRTLTFDLSVQSASYLSINIESDIYMSEGSLEATVRGNIEAALEAFFAPLVDSDGNPDPDNGTANPEIDFGWYMKDADGDPSDEIAWSRIFDIVLGAGGIRKISPSSFRLNGLVGDVTIGIYQFPVLGTVTLRNGDTGELF